MFTQTHSYLEHKHKLTTTDDTRTTTSGRRNRQGLQSACVPSVDRPDDKANASDLWSIRSQRRPFVRRQLLSQTLDLLSEVLGFRLDALDRHYLRTIIEQYGGGPVGVEAVAATMNEESDTLVDVIEPYLLRTGFVQRTRGGRRASPAAYTHLSLQIPEGLQGDLWSAAGESTETGSPAGESG